MPTKTEARAARKAVNSEINAALVAKRITFREAARAVREVQTSGNLPADLAPKIRLGFKESSPLDQFLQSRRDSVIEQLAEQGQIVRHIVDRQETVVYKSTKAFDKDALLRASSGWVVKHVSDPSRGRITLTRSVLLLPAALRFRKGRGEITVTWVRYG